MNTPWKHNTTTLEKMEDRVTDFFDGIDLEDTVKDLRERMGSVDDLKARIGSVDDVKGRIPGVKAPRKSHRVRNLLLLGLVGGGAAAYFASRKSSTPPTPAYVPPAPTPTASSGSATP